MNKHLGSDDLVNNIHFAARTVWRLNHKRENAHTKYLFRDDKDVTSGKWR